MKLGKKLAPENLIFHNMKNKKLVKKLVPENPPKTGNFGTQQAFLNLVRMMEMILNQQESWQCWRSCEKEWNLERKVVVEIWSEFCPLNLAEVAHLGLSSTLEKRQGKVIGEENHNLGEMKITMLMDVIRTHRNVCWMFGYRCLPDVWRCSQGNGGEMFAICFKTNVWRYLAMFADKCLLDIWRCSECLLDV